MTTVYRDYQRQLAGDVFKAFEKYDRVMAQMPTASGKTITTALIIEQWPGDARVLVHRGELKTQWELVTNAEVLTIQQLTHKAYTDTTVYSKEDLLVIDESHHYIDNDWHKAVESWPGKILGLTATPWRMKGGFDHFWQKLIQGPSKKELIADGHVLPSIVKNPKFGVIQGKGESEDGDFSVSATMAEFAKSAQQRAAMTELGIKWMQAESPNGKFIVFCLNKVHANAVLTYAESQGLSAQIVLSSTAKAVRAKAFKEFRFGSLQLLITVAVLTEGVDLPECDGVLILRPTRSLALYLQMVGRANRVSNGQEYSLILDASGNHTRLGHPDDAHLWSLRARRGEYRELLECPECGTMNDPENDVCDFCDAQLHEDSLPHSKKRNARIICQLCGHRRSVLIQQCPFCTFDITKAELTEADAPEHFGHRNVLFTLVQDVYPLKYHGEATAIDAVVWLYQNGNEWHGGIRVPEDSKYADLIPANHEGEVNLKNAISEQPYKLVDRLLDKTRLIQSSIGV